MDMPMFPGLVDNPHWKARWHTSGAAALSPVCSRDSPWVEDTIGLMLKLKPLLRDLLPGDFPLCHYDGAVLPARLATGMKFHSAQQWMQAHAPATFGLVDLANWTILAYEEAPRCPVSVACHGEVAHHTGPTSFVKQVRIMEKSATRLSRARGRQAALRCGQRTIPLLDWRSCSALLTRLFRRASLPSSQTQLRSWRPTRLLSTFPCGFSGLLRVILRPQLARTMMHSRRAHDLDYSNLSVNELCRISPNMRKGLKQLHPKMTWHAVEELFEVDPFLWSMHYCLCDSALRLMSKRRMKIVDIDVAALRAS